MTLNDLCRQRFQNDQEVAQAQATFVKTSLEYVLHLQRVQEGKKTEFVETILRFMYGWLTFYHQGHEVANDFTSFNTDLQRKLQKTRESLEITNSQAEHLMRKMLSEKPDPGSLNRMYTREGYLYLLEKKHLGSVWTKHFCQYRKEDRKFTMIPYSQNGSQKVTNCETLFLAECVRRMSETIDRRYCFDVTLREPRTTVGATVYTFQALNAEDHRLWLAAMDGKEPRPLALSAAAATGVVGSAIVPSAQQAVASGAAGSATLRINDSGLHFVYMCIEAIEMRGLDDQGLYRTAGVSSKVSKLAQLAFDSNQIHQLNLMDSSEWEVKTIASALKHYLRSLPEPLMTFRLHQPFIQAAKLENAQERVNRVEKLIQELPLENYRMLKVLVEHLVRVSDNKAANLMSVSNLGVCLGPTLLRPEEETVAAIMDIKFCNVIVEILIEHFSEIFSRDASPVTQLVAATATSLGSSGSNSSMGSLGSNVATGFEASGRQDNVTRHAQGNSSQSMQSIQPQQSQQHQQQRCAHRTDQQQKQIGHMQVVSPTGLASTYHHASGTSSSNNVVTTASSQHLSPPHVQEGLYSCGDVLRSYTAVPVGNSAIVNGSGSIATASNTSSSSAVPQVPLRHQYVSHASSYPLGNQWGPRPAVGNQTPSPTQMYQQPAAYGSTSTNVPNYSATASGSQPTLSSHGSISTVLMNSGSLKASTSLTATGGHHAQATQGTHGCRVRTLYACFGETEQELSFVPNQIITDVRPSREAGWLEGVLNGKRGLIPENYVQYLRD